jgi:L-amino acid N-acyltransferase YncA
MPAPFTLRPAEISDLPEVLAIYAAEVRHGTASFEIEPPDLAELTGRRGGVAQLGLPWPVAGLA